MPTRERLCLVQVIYRLGIEWDCKKKLKSGGFSLIEVLISIFVLAVGVIGVAGMQLTALHTSQQSAFQTVALQLASEMADRMRANDAQMKLDDGANPFLFVDYKSSAEQSTASSKLCYAAQCDNTELAKFDIHEWGKRVATSLPGGRALICRDSMPWDSAKGALKWECNTGNSAPVVIKLGWLGKGKNPDGSLINDPKEPFPPSVAVTVKPYTK